MNRKTGIGRNRWKAAGAVCLAGLMTMSLLSGCGFNSQASEKQVSADNTDALNIIVWDGTWSEDMFKDFTKETGIKVNISYISNTDELLTKMVDGSASYDLIDLESAYVKSFVDNDLLAKIDDSKIPNESYIKSDYTKDGSGAIGDENLDYTVPDMAPNYTTVVYNKETCPITITSLKDLANPALKGQVALVDSTISLYGAALRALGYQADSTNKDEMKQANDLLLQIKQNTKAFVGETAVPQLEDGECSVALCWDYPTLCGDSKDNWDKFGFVNLDGGCEYFMQYFAVPKSSTHKEAAEELINFILKPEELAKSYSEYALPTVENEDALAPYLPSDYFDSPAIDGMNSLYDDAWKIAVNDDQISLMDEYYTELKGE
ncbi:MAG: PotD/PotF family extracellular solute-binding protein [Chordicoccus sp.]|jgi:spermidine/putrescine transport system substrate-binding protein